jgi:hypothetical protein
MRKSHGQRATRSDFEDRVTKAVCALVYLLALVARRHEATFVTFDARMRHLSAPGAALEVLGQPA